MLSSVMILPALLLALAPSFLPAPRGSETAPADDPATGSLLRLSSGHAATLWAEVDEELEPATLPAPWPEWSDRSAAGWGGPDPWHLWVAAVRAEAAGSKSDPVARAALARFALARGRYAEAWAHFEAAGSAPDVLAAIAPVFFPGVPAGHPVVAGGTPAPLECGVLLRPALPPPHTSGPVPPPQEEHMLEHPGFEVGGARISMKLILERDGVQVDLRHLAGEAVTLRVVLPLPPGEEIGVTYRNWTRLLDPAAPIEVRLAPAAAPPPPPIDPDAEEAEEPEDFSTAELWGRFRRREGAWPSRLPATRPAPLELGGIAILAPPGAPAYLDHVADALAALLDTTCTLHRGFTVPPSGPLTPLVLRLDTPDAGERKLAALLSLAERFALKGTEAR